MSVEGLYTTYSPDFGGESPLSLEEREARLIKSRQQVAKRRQREQDKLKEEEFLRTSLRASERLRALERAKKAVERERQRQAGRENKAFIEDETVPTPDVVQKPVLPLDEVNLFLSDLHSSLARDQTQGDNDSGVSEDEWSFLHSFVASPNFNRAYHLQDAVSDSLVRWNMPSPLSTTALSHSYQSLEALKQASRNPDTLNSVQHQMIELRSILKQPELQSVLVVHDDLAHTIYPPKDNHLPDDADVNSDVMKPRVPRTGHHVNGDVTGGVSPSSVEDTTLVGRRGSGEERRKTEYVIHSSIPGCLAKMRKTADGMLLKTVVLQKGEEPLGATVRNEGNAVVIGRIVIGGVAYKSGLLREGDEILSVNSIDMVGKDVNTVSDLLARMKGDMTFEIAPVDDGCDMEVDRSDQLYQLRALFTYHPADDLYIPCKEIGLSFEKGDILYVINSNDPNWWQGFRDGEDTAGLAGILPSPEFQRQREYLRRQHAMGGDPEWPVKSSADDKRLCACPPHRRRHEASPSSANGAVSKKKRKGDRKSYFPNALEHIESEEIHTYEQVDRYYPQPHRKRPIVLVGPPQVGRHELLLRVVESDPEKFQKVTSHSTLDTGTKNYILIPRSEFQSMMDDNQFIEYGIFEKNYYGTSRKSVADAIQAGKICVLSLKAESIKAMRETHFLPYVIFIAPPTGINALRTLRMQLNNGIRPSDDELLQTIELSHEMEDKYGHWFDRIIINNDLESSFVQLMEEIGKLEVEPQWVPKDWLYAANQFTDRDIDESEP